VEANHPEYQELKQPGNPRGLDIVMRERSELRLPPFSELVALKGEDRVLQRLRISLESDQLFRNPQNVIFPVHDGRMILKIDSEQRLELLRLLQEMTRIRSAKRLPRIDYDFDPEDM
jgi:primosomal protein N'